MTICLIFSKLILLVINWGTKMSCKEHEQDDIYQDSFFRIPVANRKGRPRKKKSRNAKGFVIREIDGKDVYIELK